MLSKEEIEINLKALSGVMLNFEDRLCDEMQERVKEVKDYIDNLESDKQKLIEKLEEDIRELEALNDNYTEADIIEGIYTTRGQIIKAKEILSILKGE